MGYELAVDSQTCKLEPGGESRKLDATIAANLKELGYGE